jgi:hypothetical protein
MLQAYVASFLSGCCLYMHIASICFKCFQVFHTYVCKCFIWMIFFANYTSTNIDAQHAPMNRRTQTLPLCAPSKDYASTSQKLTKSPHASHLEIDEVATGASPSMERSCTTKSTMSLNPEINPEKYEHPCQIENLNLGGQIPPQGI